MHSILGSIAVRGLLILFVCAFALPVLAQSPQSLTFTVTPPLFQLSLEPGERWSSQIQVVNQNPYAMTVYAEPVLFTPSGESGKPVFIHTMTGGEAPIAQDPSTFAGWMTLPTQAYTIPAEQTYSLPIVISVPEDATPGGHYAAVLIGNTPPSDRREGGVVSVTSTIASLFFLRVAGDVREEGRIREFSTVQSLYETAEASFTLRFENQGNVHLQPQGDITIFNMWGKKRGYIPVNHVDGYGSVLPDSIRSYAFVWESDTGMWDIGRYRAVATVGYGKDTTVFTNATLYFWVLPVWPLVQVLAGVLFLVWGFGWAVRAYVRHALRVERSLVAALRQHEDEEDKADTTHQTREEQSAQQFTARTLLRPIQGGVVEVQSRMQPRVDDARSDAHTRQVVTADTTYVRPIHYGALLLFVAFCAVAWVLASAFVDDVTVSERSYRALEERASGETIELPQE